MKLNQKPWTMDDVKREMDHYREFKPELGEIMDLYADLLAVEDEYRAKIETGLEREEFEEITRKIGEGQTLLDTKKIHVDPDLFKEVLSRMADVLSAKNPDLKEGFDRLLAYPDLKVDTEGENPVFIANLLAFNTQYFTKVAELLEINSDIFFFLIYRAIGPFLEAAALEYRDTFDYQHWQKTVCPVCGRKPSMSFMRREDGMHLLQCQACRTQWTYPRSKCVVCGNDSNETYKYLFDEADEAHRIYVCDSCKKYIKSTDARALDRDVDIEVEDLATLVLDYVAKERGYEPGSRITFAVSIDYPEPGEGEEMPEEISLD